MHLLVLSAFRQAVEAAERRVREVSMHLLVLSAFRQLLGHLDRRGFGLNAPSGAQCFPTSSSKCPSRSSKRLNAPSGAQCFPTRRRGGGRMLRSGVSMHLLVLSAFRL